MGNCKMRVAFIFLQIIASQAKLTPKSDEPVFFTANLSKNMDTVEGTIRWNHVVSESGNAYSPITGKFTAPSDGTYFFSFFVLPFQKESVIGLKLVVDNFAICYAYGRDYSATGSCSQTIFLRSGQ